MPMVIGVLQIELSIDGAQSLKDKRRVVNSVKDRLHRRHMVSVAEVATQEDPTTATLGIVLAASDAKYARGLLDRIVNALRNERGCVLADHQTEILSGV